MVRVSIIIPTKNNADVLKRCLKSIYDMDYPMDEIEVIVVDGHSTDNTIEIAERYGCKVVYEDVGTIGGARNVGVEHSSGEFIVFTDADCVVDRNWLKNLLREFKDEKVASVGGPNITPEDDTELAKCVGVVLELLSKPGARYAFNADRVLEVRHNPTCNSAYRKSAFLEVGGFNPKLVTCDDEELDYRIRKKGYKILFTPYAKVYHYRKPTWKKFAKMAWNYGVGRGQVVKLHRELAKWYYCAPSAIIALIAIFLAPSLAIPWLSLVAISILVAGSVGIGIMSLYLASKTRWSRFLTYYLLIAIWFWGYGLGMLRGLFKPAR
jgi:glycosyltransferase involved in cell wall biosynthesis